MFVDAVSCASERRPPLSAGNPFPSDVGEGPQGAVSRILLVEDDDAIRAALAEGLRDQGIDVAVAGHGREALDLLRSEPLPSAIVLDLMMPLMDGWDFRQEQLGDPALRDIPVVIITATGFSANTIKTQLGDVEVVAKPIRQLDLLDVLNRACTPH
jgi:CheY-like chemotaxis protein